MYNGEIIAVSPKGKGNQPEHTTILLKSEVLSSCKGSQKWLIAGDKVLPNYLKKGACQFTIDQNQTITYVKSLEIMKIKKKISNNVRAFSQLDLFELEKELNNFSAEHNVFATQVFQIKSDDKQLYDAIVHYKS